LVRIPLTGVVIEGRGEPHKWRNPRCSLGGSVQRKEMGPLARRPG